MDPQSVQAREVILGRRKGERAYQVLGYLPELYQRGV